MKLMSLLDYVYGFMNRSNTDKEIDQMLLYKAIRHDRYAQTQIAKMYNEGIQVKKNVTRARHWALQAAELDHPEAQLLLSSLLVNDSVESHFWLKKSAEHGLPEAQYYLALSYYDGMGTSVDNKQAFLWFKKAAEQGHPEAQYNVAMMIFDGDGVPSNAHMATVWLMVAAANHHKHSSKLLIDIKEKLPPLLWNKAQTLATDYAKQYNNRRHNETDKNS